MTRPADRWGGGAGRAVLAGMAASGVALLRVRDPNVPGSYGRCPSLALFGIYCPLCGSLRAVHALASGDAAEAWMRNPVVVLAVAATVVTVLAVLALRRAGRTPRPPSRRVVRAGQVAVVVLLIGFTVIRNPPFSLLLPT